MKQVAYYLTRLEEAQAAAHETNDAEMRLLWLRIANGWADLARHAGVSDDVLHQRKLETSPASERADDAVDNQHSRGRSGSATGS